MTRQVTRMTFSHRTRFMALLASTALVHSTAVLAQSLPTGGQVAAGSATIGSPTAGGLTINQTSGSAVVNWQSFDVGKANRVTFVQPDANAAILNRVTGETSSTIAGQINANGLVYLVNPNGIAITSSGTVKTGAFVASTLGISDDDFMAGKRTFTGNGASAPVMNAGAITINRGGYMALIGGSVANSGTITVPMGKAALGSGEQATLDLSGDGFLQVAVPTKAGGRQALVSNSGRIAARGGTVQLSAAAAKDMARQAVNMSGTIEATGVSGRSGDIVLSGSDGEVAVAGSIEAGSARGTGGKVQVTGRKIRLSNAKIDASGKTGGGTVTIGGNRQGRGALQRAETLDVDANTAIHADAITMGNGGNVVLWSDDLTRFAGTITAKGGAVYGNGGEVEVSGKAKLAYAGLTDLTAVHGAFGNLLLDPYNVTISTGTDSNTDGSFSATGNDSVINASTLTNALRTANVTVTTGSSSDAASPQAGIITVAAPIAWTSGSTLTLNGASDIYINAAINATAGGLTLASGGTIYAPAAVSIGGTFNLTSGSWIQNSATLPSFHARDFQLGGGSFLRVTGGDGTSTATAYTVTDVYGLQGIGSSNAYLSASWALASNIDASGTANWNGGAGFVPIGTDGQGARLNGNSGFVGNFDGQGHTISGLTINRSDADYVGLFGNARNASISNIGLTNVSVIGSFNVGGLVGYNDYNSIIINAFTTGAVNGASSVGGLAGGSYGTISNSYATTIVSGASSVGGLVGSNNGTITNAYATGAVSGSSGVGGLVGYDYRGSISNVYATGAATGSYWIGGLVGMETYGTITNAYATGAASGDTFDVGGLVGQNYYGTVSNAYASGAVSGAGYVGGLTGYNFGGSITNSFWDTETTGQSSGAGSNYGTLSATGLTTAQARDATSYGGWDFSNVWFQSGDMRPILRSEAATAGSNGVVTISNLHQLALIGANLDGSYKLGADIDASTTAGTNASDIWSTSGFVPIGVNGTNSAFSGSLDGQGHVISGLTINRPNDLNVALFARLDNTVGSGTAWIGNVGLSGGSINGDAYVGALVGYNWGGTVSNAWSSATVSGQRSGVGGLIGKMYAGASVTGSHATGSVTGQGAEVGGLVGVVENSSISGSYATGTVIGYGGNAGGLAGSVVNGGSITSSYATGVVFGSQTSVGGLVGYNNGTVSGSYATGAVAGDYDTSSIGGLAGYSNGSISSSYATGAVTGNYNSTSVGGLAGYSSGSISSSYATGAVTTGAAGYLVGGLVGRNDGSISSSYWDVQTSGRNSGMGLDLNGQSVTGLTTAQLQDGSSANGLGSAFTLTNGLYPYLTSFFPNGVQAISGIAYADSGVTVAASGINGPRYVYVDIGGVRTAVTTGANGYYYLTLPTGTLSSSNGGTALLAYTLDGNVVGPVSGAYLTSVNGTTGNIDIWGHTLIAPTIATSLSSAPTSASAFLSENHGANQTLLAAAIGSDTAAVDLSSLSLAGYLATGSGGFNIDQGISAYGLYVKTLNGPITVSSAQTLGGPINLSLISGGSLSINAPITINGAGSVNLAASYDTASVSGTSLLELAFGTGGSLTYANADGTAATTDQGGALSINGQAYKLLYRLAESGSSGPDSGNDDIAGIGTMGGGGFYALATNVDGANTVFTSAPVGSFAGTFEGLGHTVSNLTMSNSGANTGLFGFSSGTIRNLGMINATISASGSIGIGSLAGYNNGTIQAAYASGVVLNTSGSQMAGGLIGYNTGTVFSSHAGGTVNVSIYGGGLVGYENGGTIQSSYATTAVQAAIYGGGLVAYVSNNGVIQSSYATGSVHGAFYLGGLVGAIADGGSSTPAGTIQSSYSTGAVSGAAYLGGLVGSQQGGTIDTSFATGAVSNGGSSFGGLVGLYDHGTITNSFWDIQTSGQTSGIGTDGAPAVTGLTTAQFQDGMSAGALGSAFTLSSGLYPYLTGFFQDGVQVVSGIAYTDGGNTPLASNSNGAGVVNVRAGNGAVVTVTTGANGYYYAMFANGAIDTRNGASVLAYSPANSQLNTSDSATFTTHATGSLTGFDLYGGTLLETADAGVGSLSALDAAYTAAATGTSASGLTYANRTITVAANAFTIDRNISNAGLVSLTSAGDIAIAPGATVTGGSVRLVAPGAFINEEGFDAVTATVGNWLIYSANSGDDTFGGLDSGNTAVWNTAAGGSVSADGNRYVFAYQPTLSVSTINGSKTYGDDATTAVAGDYVVTGYQAGVAGAYRADTAATAYSGSASVTSNGAAAAAGVQAGGYAYSLGLGTLTSDVGYAFSLENTANFSVDTRSITVTANSGQSFMYGDTPVLAYTITNGNLVNGDRLSGVLSGIDSTSTVGTHAIGRGTLAASSNYALTFVGANAAVTPRTITVTADGQTRTYGEANPALTYALGGAGLVNGDALTGALATAADQRSNVGNYAIGLGSLGNSNYAISYTGAYLNVTPRAVTVTADRLSRAYGDDNPTFTYTIGGAGLVNGDNLTGSLSTSATTVSGIGTYAIGQGTLAASGNYSLSFAAGDLTVDKRAITVVASNTGRAYGDTNPAFAYTIGGAGLVNGDSLTGALSSAATVTSGIGGYAIDQGTLAASGNYTMTFTGGGLTVTPRAITVTADNVTRMIGMANPLLTYTVGGAGLANDDTLSGILVTTADWNSPVGNYTISRGSLAASANYQLSFTNGVLAVMAAPPSPTAELASVITPFSYAPDDTPLPPSKDAPTASKSGDGGAGENSTTPFLSDPRFDGTVVCLTDGADCIVQPAQP
ncbi:MAG: filamentous hemagglutinin N-terminal domain-containing protein [Rhizobium sp.]|nr:MAG: filamentous hemagglutinin N-terminal domain-containing protein [Rhizobium sp.]